MTSNPRLKCIWEDIYFMSIQEEKVFHWNVEAARRSWLEMPAMLPRHDLEELGEFGEL